MGLLGSPLIAPAKGGSLCILFGHFGQRIRVDDQHHRFALRILGPDDKGRGHDADIGESSFRKIIAQFLTEMRWGLPVRRCVLSGCCSGRIHRCERGTGKAGAKKDNKHGPG